MFDSIQFNPMAFVENLHYMGKGMLGIFVVIGIIIIAVYALGAFGKALSKKDSDN